MALVCMLQPQIKNKMEDVIKTKKVCSVWLNRNNQNDEMDLDYSLIEEKVKELNNLGIDITLQEIGDIIETKFVGKPCIADLRRWDNGAYNGKLLHPQYTLLRPKISVS